MGLRAFALVVLAALAARAEEYPIGCCTFMKQEVARPVEQVVKDWKDLGITHPMSPEFGHESDKGTMLRMLDLCAKEGLHLLVHDLRADLLTAIRAGVTKDDAAYRKGVEAAVADWGHSPAFDGLFLYDEPHKEHNAPLFAAAKVIRETIPGKRCFISILPWYDWIHRFTGAKACAPYLDMMARETGLKVLEYDLYDHMSADIGEDRGLDYYFENLREWMEWTKREPGRRFWATQLCINHASRVVSTQAEYRWQISTAAAMGAKGITWYYPDYCPRPGESLGNCQNAPINILGERTEFFNWLSVENRTFSHQYGSEFMRLQIEDAALVGMERGGLRRFSGDRDVLSVESGKRPTLVSFFHDDAGVRYMALVNLDRRASSRIVVGLAAGVEPTQRSWHGTYETKGLAQDPVLASRYGKGAAGQITCWMAPGQLALVRLARKPGVERRPALAGLSRPSEVASAIQREIDAVSAAGGGRVVLPAGEWVSGTIWLRSGVELKLEKGCVLKASPDQSDYNAFDAYPQNFGIAKEYWNAHHFIICHECRDVAITGPGEINGNGDAFYDEKPIRYESWMKPDATAWWNGIRWAKDKTALRPGQLVVFVESSDIRVENLTIRNSPCWSLFFHGCERVRVRDYTVRNGHDDGNSDGIDIDCSFDVTVENADIDTGDDAVAIRADGAKLKRPRACERIRLRNLKLGSQSSVFRLGVGKGEIRDVVVENVDCNRGGTAINLRTSYFGKDQVTDIGDITFRNCRFRNCREALNVYLSGETLKYGIRNVRLDNCDFGGAMDHVTVASGCPFKEADIVRSKDGM